MLKHYFIVAIRLIKRSILFSSINILGFVLGMTAAFLISLWIMDELTFEDFHENRNTIYRVIKVTQDETGKLSESAEVVAPLSETFRDKFAQVKNATCVKYNSKMSLQFGKNVIEGKLAYVDTTFFDMFSFPVVEGNPNNMKTDPGQIVLSENMARKLFGRSSAVGKEVRNYRYGKESSYKVAAVIKVPRKSHFQFEILKSRYAYIDRMDWGFSEWIQVYIQLKDNTVLTDADWKAMSRVWVDRGEEKTILTFQPLNDIHLHSNFKDAQVTNNGSMSQIYLFLVLSVLVIFMGAFNFMTLSTARASLRFKEIGVRKITGAKRKTLIFQFFSESMVQVFLSLLLALALTELLLPFFNMMVEKDISLRFSWQIFLFVMLSIFGIGSLSGSYPAFYMSSLNPLLAFKGGTQAGKKGNFIKILVCVQFVIAIVLILCTSIVYKQLQYMQNKDLGLNKENIVSVESSLWYEVDNFKQEVLKNPYVKSVAMGASISDLLKGFSWEEQTVEWYKENGDIDSLQMVNIFVDGDFVKTYGLTLIKGKLLEADVNAYWDGTYEFPVIINETAWKMMKVENPIGMQFMGAYGRRMTKIVGVVKDFNFQTLREKVKPAYLIFSPETLNWLHIKLDGEDKAETLKFLKEKYEMMNPGKVFTYQFFTDALNQNYASERQQSQVTILTILIAMMGVLGLVALASFQRTKEIGIRKVSGAHADRIIKMFCYEYMKWVGIAFLIACPLGYLFMNRWLSSFAYQTTISWWLFPLAGCIILLITVLTVIIQTWRAASRNPVKSLRYE